MKSNIIVSNANFSIVENKISLKHGLEFRIVNFSIPYKEIIEGKVTVGQIGTINESVNDIKIPIKMPTKISAFKNNILYDSVYTDLGKYTLYLEKGIYDIRIESELHTKTVKNYNVIDGIETYRKFIKHGQILKKLNNTVEFSSITEKLINGVIIDQYGLPVESAELIVANMNDGIEAFIKTDENGKYSFLLKESLIDIDGNEIKETNYDIIIRSPKHNAKIIRNYSFNSEKGFLLDLLDKNSSNYNVTFKKDGEWLWISTLT